MTKTEGKRVYCEGDDETPLLEPGAYGIHPRDGGWYACTPNGHLGNLKGHEVTEHEDGTITVTPSILVVKPGTLNNAQKNLWHGFLEKGVWRSC